jgi:hypothetical protein
MKSPSLADAMLAAEQGKLHEWILSFLRASGANPGLAGTLEKDGKYYLGPVKYPLKDLVNIIGPDNSYKYQEAESALNARVAAMVTDIQKGWQPPPLIVTNFWEDYWEIADGGHRLRAFQKLGMEVYPTIFYFRDKDIFDTFKQEVQGSSP